MEKVKEYQELLGIVLSRIGEDAVAFANNTDLSNKDAFEAFRMLGEWLEKMSSGANAGHSVQLSNALSVFYAKIRSLQKISNPVYIEKRGRLMLATPEPFYFRSFYDEGDPFKLSCKFVGKDGGESREFCMDSVTERYALGHITDISDWEWVVEKKKHALVGRGDWKRKSPQISSNTPNV